MKGGTFFVTFQIHALYSEENKEGTRDEPQFVSCLFSEIRVPLDKVVFASVYAGGLLLGRSSENVVGAPTVWLKFPGWKFVDPSDRRAETQVKPYN